MSAHTHTHIYIYVTAKFSQIHHIILDLKDIHIQPSKMLFSPHIQSTIRNLQYQMSSDIQQVMSILSADSTSFLLYQTTQCSLSPAGCHYQLYCHQYKNKCDWNGSGCIKM